MKQKSNHPINARRIMRVTDLPQDRGPAKYEIRNGEGKPRVVTLSKRQRQIIDLLREGPVHCASPVRLSDTVHILKCGIGLDVKTEMFPGDPKTGSGAYGVYLLRSRVTPLGLKSEVAA